MKKLFAALAVVAVALIGAPAFAGNTADQPINFSIPAVDELTLSTGGAAISLAVEAPAAGVVQLVKSTGNPNTATSYALTVNQAEAAKQKITAGLSTAMPAYTVLTVIASPNAASLGEITNGNGSAGAAGIVFGALDSADPSSTTAQDLVTGIFHAASVGNGLSYQFDATKDAEIDDFATTVNYSIVAE